MKSKNTKQTTMGRKNKLSSVLKYTRTSGIAAFTETPAEEKPATPKTTKDKKLDASDLFSQFTANIIKEDVVFTR
jgi:hypothetical protein